MTTAATTAATNPVAIAHNPGQPLSAEILTQLNQRSNPQGALQVGLHGAMLLLTGKAWAIAQNHFTWTNPLTVALALLCLLSYGFTLAVAFAPVHEGVHRSVFTQNRANDILAWWAGVLSFYNSTFYRRYHQWHHRYTRIPGKDPELTDLTPRNWREYLWVLSGIPWWLGKLQGHCTLALGRLEGYGFIPEAARAAVIRSTRWQLAVYGGAIALSFWVGHPWFWQYWLLPLAVGQPMLRFLLLAEHTGCSLDGNLLTNTRTTLTLWPLQRLFWNMPFHAEHHLYPSIPFHQLPLAHRLLRDQLTQVAPGYIHVNRQIISDFATPVLPSGHRAP